MVRRQISSPVLHSSVAASQFETKYDATVIMKIHNTFPLSIIMMKISPPSKIGKGQLILECPYEIIVSPKIPTKLFPGFLPWPLKSGQINKIKALYYTN